MSDPQSQAFQTTPHTEKYMLESENLRRRQLQSALLHGSARKWRERRRIWPAALAGFIAVAVIIAVIGVYGAFQRQQRILDEEQRRRQSLPVTSAYVGEGPNPSMIAPGSDSEPAGLPFRS